MWITTNDDDETRWHQDRRGANLPGQLPPPEHTQLRVDSDNTDSKYCNNCQYVGNFILTQPIINRIPDGYASSRNDAIASGKPLYEKKHDTIRLGNLADLRANQGCVCCQSIISALENRMVTHGLERVAIGARLHDWEAELCWNGDMFSCILHCREDNKAVAFELRLSRLPCEPESLDSGSFPYHKYRRLMDVYKIDTTIIQEWIETCDRLHGPESQKTAPFLSTSKLEWLYLIDLEKQCLVKVDTAQNPQYIALSYVWGGMEMLKTTSENLEKMLQPGALIDSQGTKGPKLARTITDAMDLARKLSCPFFWTDCICIVQGPGQEEIDERTMFLNEMAFIYANAYVTIVAAEGADGNSGIPGIGRCSEPRDTLWSEMQFPGHTLLLGRDCDTRHALYGRDKTWSTRGWTFQESYLSRRVLVFTSIVSFHCQKHTSCEWDLVPHGMRRGWIDRISFVCNVPNWPDIAHYISVVLEYSRKNLSFDDDTLDAFAGVTTVLKQSFYSGFHYGLPEMFFDASLLWEPDWANSTPLQLRKTEKLSLPSWSWVRTRGPRKLSIWKHFAQDFYKDTSFKNIYSLKPLVQWWKTRPQGEAPKLITYQHFSNHASMPPGWTSRGNGERHEIKYSHSSSPDTKYLHPFPFPETAEAPLPDVEYGPLLRCVAHRGWLVKSNKFEKFDTVTMHGTFNLCLSDGTWAGILFDDRLDQGFPQKSSEKCEVIAIAEGRVPGMDDDYSLPEYRVIQRAIFPGEEVSGRRDFCYEFYFILWIGWVDGIAYRRGIGRVLKGVWENMELEEIGVTLG